MSRLPENQTRLKARQRRYVQAQKDSGAFHLSTWISKTHEEYFQRLMQHTGLGRMALVEYLLEQAVQKLDREQS